METLEFVLETKGSTAVHVVEPEATVLEAVGKMCAAHVGALLVVRDETLVGVFSERDVMVRVVLDQRDPATTCVAEVMTPAVITVPLHSSAHEAMSVMTSRRVRHLPVTDGSRIAGVVSIGDLVRWAVSDRDRLIDELEEYVAGRYPG
ncbi:MAG TPA: CBS domain-containing protein [Polyangiaceae bacterium]|jgi:CBS domain-containing protein